MRALPSLIAWLAIAAPALSAAGDEGFYSAADFARVEKIDAHVHIHGTANRFMTQAARDHFRILTINVDYPDFPSLPEQQRDAVSLKQRYPGRVAFAAAFSVTGFQQADWAEGAIRQIDTAAAQGAVGVKIWKNIGMTLRDPDGRYVMIDDARFEPVLAELERRHLVLLAHQAEPLNCWLPMDQMTVRSDREYFSEHPQYYMHDHPEMPSHDAILEARDRMIGAHPTLRLDAVHLASLEWDVDRVAAFLDRFPNAAVDLAARLVHLEYQATRDPAKVRAFLMRYQDRVLYGSDNAYGPRDDDAQAVADIHAGWLHDWRFLTSSDRMYSTDFGPSFRGLHLPREVIDKIYRRNAEALFAGGWN